MKLVTFFVAAAALVSATAASAQNITIKSEAGGEQIIVTIPDGWKRVHSDKGTADGVRSSIYKYLPPGKVVTDWDKMITIVVMNFPEEIKADIEKNTAVAMTKTFYSSHCKDHPDEMSIFPNTVNGFATAAFSAGCDVRNDVRNTANSKIYLRNVEFLSGIVIRGTKTLFQIQHTWHSDLLKGDANGNLTGPDEELLAMRQAAEEATELSFEGFWPCDTSRKGRSCKKPSKN